MYDVVWLNMYWVLVTEATIAPQFQPGIQKALDLGKLQRDNNLT
jgi:hypothetical protein